MKHQETHPARLFSTLDPARGRQVRDCLPAGNMQWLTPAGDWLTESFWQALGAGRDDLVLVDLAGDTLSHIIERFGPDDSPVESRRPWFTCAATVVAILPEGEIADAAAAARLDFDGLLVEPLEPGHVARHLLLARGRANRRHRMDARYGRVRRLCRAMNRKRRSLREQVDLLCGDLVNSNMQFAQTLQGMQRVYDLLYGLTGEFDLRYLLHKALRSIRRELSDASAAVYLCSHGEFLAHLADPQADPDDLADLEDAFTDIIVAEVLATLDPVIIPTPAQQEPFLPESPLRGLSVLALPVRTDFAIVGVVVVYRSAQMPLTVREQHRIAPMMEPLGRAIAAAEKVQHLAGGR